MATASKRNGTKSEPDSLTAIVARYLGKKPVKQSEVVEKAQAVWIRQRGKGSVPARFPGMVWHALQAVGRKVGRGEYVLAGEGKSESATNPVGQRTPKGQKVRAREAKAEAKAQAKVAAKAKVAATDGRDVGAQVRIPKSVETLSAEGHIYLNHELKAAIVCGAPDEREIGKAESGAESMEVLALIVPVLEPEVPQ